MLNTLQSCICIQIFSLSAIIFLVSGQPALSYHGKEILLKLGDGQFLQLPDKNVQQVRLTVIYSVVDPDILGKQVSATMKVYAPNEAIIKTSSVPNGIMVEQSGFHQFVTTLPNSTINFVTAVVVFTDQNKTSPLSNSLPVKLAQNKTI